MFTLAALIALGLEAVAPAGSSPSKLSFSEAQALTGSHLFAAKCATCHGAHLEGGAGPALAGAALTTLAKATSLTVGDAFTFISKQMPLNEPGSLTHAQYVAIMAYILQYNGYAAGPKPLTYDGAANATAKLRSYKS
jgi:mono/diheme cytochrome c family protein